MVLKPGVGSSSRAAKSVKRWFALLPDFVLYAFRTELDERAMTATPLPGYTVLSGAQLRGDPAVAERDRDKIIKMFVQQSSNGVNSSSSDASQLVFQKVYYFAGSSVEEVQRSEARTCLCCVCLLSLVELTQPRVYCVRLLVVLSMCCLFRLLNMLDITSYLI